MHMRRAGLLAVLGLALEGLFIFMGYGLSTALTDIVPFVVLCLASYLVYIAALALVWKAHPDRRLLFLILGFGLLFRVTLVPVEGNPYFPDADAYRYVWDGGVTAAGLNPYRYSPQEVLEGSSRPPGGELTPYGRLAQTPPFDRMLPEVEYPGVKTIYPPVSQYLFALAAKLSPGRLAPIKLLLAMLEGGTLWLLVRILEVLGRNRLFVLVYAWSPLVIEEFAYAGHHDALAVFFLVLTLFWLVRGRAIAGGGSIGLAIMSKAFPIVLIPILARRLSWKGILLAAVVSIAATLPFLGAGMDLLSGFSVFAHRWKSNAGAFALLEVLLGGAGARLTVSAIVIGISCWFFCRPARGIDQTLLQILIVLTATLLLSPVLNPWYVTWIIPLLCIFPSRPLLLLTGSVFLHYLYFIHFKDTVWLRIAEYGPVFAWLLFEFIAYGRRKYLRHHPCAERGARPAASPAGDPSGLRA